MSSRRKRSYTRRTAPRNSLNWEDDNGLALLATLTTGSASRPRGRPKSNPKRPRTQQTRTPNPVEVIEVDSPETSAMARIVNARVDSLFQGFISSDDEETDMIKAKINKKPSPNPFFISDDSDDDVVMQNSARNIDLAKPSTSSTTNDIPKDNKDKNIDDSVMIYVDSLLDIPPIDENKSLEDYRKETEELLKNASTLNEELATGRKPEPVPEKKEESPAKITMGSCPVCFEYLGTRPTAVTVCGHIFCKECITKAAQTLKKCPTCRKPINSKKFHPIYF